MLIDKSPELKKAVLDLPQNEKDKLLLKLISKDVVLLSQLAHKLLEGNSDLEQRVEIIKHYIDKKIDYINRYIADEYNYSPGYFMMDIREMSGLINEHLLITKEKITELELRIYLIESVISCEATHHFILRSRHNEKLLNYFGGRIKYVFEKYTKLHEDIQFDYSERLNFILRFSNQSSLKNVVEMLGLPSEV